MKPKSIRDGIIALAAIIVALAAADLLDQASFLLRQQASQTFDFLPALWLPPLAQSADAAGLVILIWWLATRANFPRVIDALYALAGLAAALAIPLAFTTHLSLFDALAFNGGGRVSCWTMTGAVLAVAGPLHLFRRRPKAESPAVLPASPP